MSIEFEILDLLHQAVRKNIVIGNLITQDAPYGISHFIEQSIVLIIRTVKQTPFNDQGKTKRYLKFLQRYYRC